MKKDELINFLIAKKVPNYFYNLDGIGEVDQRVCLEFEGEWVVFYSERGKKFDSRRYLIEDEACQDILNRLLS